MPLYEYQSPAGLSVLEHRPVDRRDDPLVLEGVTFTRRTVPSRLTIGVGARPETTSEKTWKGYRHLELAGKLDDRPGYLPASKVKAALLEPETD